MGQLFVFVAFVLLLYVPALVFRFVANTWVDLTSRKFPNQIEDFFAAAAPSLLLNLITAFLLNTITLWRFADVMMDLPQLLTGGWATFLHDHLAWVGLYLLLLMVVTAVSGYVYGWVDLLQLQWPLDTDVPSSAARVPEEVWAWAQTIHDIWQVFFEPLKVPLFALKVQPTYVFVKTTDGRKIHGRFNRYDVTGDGTVTSIRLAEVVRLQKWANAVEGKDVYEVPMSGTMLIKWDEVADINIADFYTPETLQGLRVKLENERAKWKKNNSALKRLRRLLP